MRKLISHCELCGKISFMACYDTAEEVIDASKSVRQLAKQGRTFDIITHEPGDPMPEWCPGPHTHTIS